jgi:hypothetical protein
MLSSFFSLSQCRSCCVIRHVDLCSFFRFCSHIFSLIKWGKACQVQAPGRRAPLAGRGDKEARHQREPMGICLLFARHRREWPAQADVWSGKAAEGVGDAAFGDSPEGHGLGVCKNVVLKVELRLGGVRPTCLPAVIFFAVWRMPLLHRTNSWFYRLLHMRKRGSTGFLHVCISSLSLWTSHLLYYMQPYGLLSSVLHFIKRAMLKVLSWGQSRLKKKRNEKTGASMKIKRVWVFSFCTERNERW